MAEDEFNSKIRELYEASKHKLTPMATGLGWWVDRARTQVLEQGQDTWQPELAAAFYENEKARLEDLPDSQIG